MTKTFILLLKESTKIYTYSSLSAIFEEFDKETLCVSKFSLDRVDFSHDFYENEKIRIELSQTKTTGDVRRDKKQI